MNYDNILHLGFHELESGNYARAIEKFSLILENQNRSRAWLGLGIANVFQFYHFPNGGKEDLQKNVQSAVSLLERSYLCADFNQTDDSGSRMLLLYIEQFCKKVCDDSIENIRIFKKMAQEASDAALSGFIGILIGNKVGGHSQFDENLKSLYVLERYNRANEVSKDAHWYASKIKFNDLYLSLVITEFNKFTKQNRRFHFTEQSKPLADFHATLENRIAQVNWEMLDEKEKENRIREEKRLKLESEEKVREAKKRYEQSNNISDPNHEFHQLRKEALEFLKKGKKYKAHRYAKQALVHYSFDKDLLKIVKTTEPSFLMDVFGWIRLLFNLSVAAAIVYGFYRVIKWVFF